MTLDWETLRLSHRQRYNAYMKGAVKGVQLESLADAASRKMLGECIAELQRQALECRTNHRPSCPMSASYMKIACDWQQVLEAAKGQG